MDFKALNDQLEATPVPELGKGVGNFMLYDSLIAGLTHRASMGEKINFAEVPNPDPETVNKIVELYRKSNPTKEDSDFLNYFSLLEEIRRALLMETAKETRELTIEGKEYNVTVERFGEDIDIEAGATYHGFYIEIIGFPRNVFATKYDDVDSMHVDGVQESDTNSISVLKQIAKQLFNTEKLLVNTSGEIPYKEI